MDKKKKRPIDEFPWQEYDKREFEEKYPNLTKELEKGPEVVIEGYKNKEEEEEVMDFSGYNPTVIDFIRRCETDEEALEIINWMEDHGEIPHELAKELRIKLTKEGVRSFGSKKEWGWYERHRKR
ncbi:MULTISPECIES: DUF2095 family protein [Thermococcus]|uniref:DUF2095 domain-containing protein n=2 Tax=Thermococcus sibiricus TaxID=172049 RepID=C6A2A1_THESM|nr:MULTISPECIES: DUF2095 family protein [Thermococcus]KUK28535.1 MAG: Uncharacterized protein XD61_0922 [Thermococcus sp. 40_45]HII67531.1 DUF2095 family protein [Thermococcaceae archaeon]ACS89746.1 hypothetical protein TSIB_0681 [Thermococcus sibiricus MM 739]KUK17155.1 MAG: Uncharacterized protein XD54_1576 [Thermococcus sibiricus]MBC7094335.1 DUF2095 family protein [Thermococcus sp.]